jgi:hypothetical protein
LRIVRFAPRFVRVLSSPQNEIRNLWAIFDRARGHALRWSAVAGILRRLDGRYVVPVGTIRTGFIILA